MKYELLQVKTIYHFEPSENGRSYIKIVANNDKHFQIKFDTNFLKSNQNEFISNYIGFIIDAPVFKGAFLDFSEQQLIELFKFIHERFPNHIPDMSNIKGTIMFGIEWENNAIHARDHDELLEILKQTRNKESFYSLFSYDQYLKNLDRHLGNHLFNRDANGYINNYFLIDGDRIFMARKLSNLNSLKNNFDCLRNTTLTQENDYHTFLYSFVNDETIFLVIKYAVNIDNISLQKIDYMIEVMKQVYNLTKNDYDTMREYLIYRKENILFEMSGKSDCFPNLIQKRLGYSE